MDVVTSDLSVIFGFDLAEGISICRPVSGRIEWIRL
jgi:hypothetical protein